MPLQLGAPSADTSHRGALCAARAESRAMISCRTQLFGITEVDSLAAAGVCYLPVQEEPEMVIPGSHCTSNKAW